MERRSIVILSFDTLGDLILRQPLFSALLDNGCTIAVAVRRNYEMLLRILDPRLKAIHQRDQRIAELYQQWGGRESALGESEAIRAELARELEVSQAARTDLAQRLEASGLLSVATLAPSCSASAGQLKMRLFS